MSRIAASGLMLILSGCHFSTNPGNKTRESGAILLSHNTDPEGLPRDSKEDSARSIFNVSASSTAATRTIFRANSLLVGQQIVQLYPVENSTDSIQAIGYVKTADAVRAIDEKGTLLWESKWNPAEGASISLFGVGDFDGDGRMDVALQRARIINKDGSPVKCGDKPMHLTWIEFVQSANGKIHSPLSPLESICWSFKDILHPNGPNIVYPTKQWTNLSVTIAAKNPAGIPVIAALPYYPTQGWFLSFHLDHFVSDSAFYYPSTPAFDGYTESRPNAYGQAHAYVKSSDVFNGYLSYVGKAFRFLFFTSARVVQYNVGPLDSKQLATDTPYLAANRTDLAGRNKGLVMDDPSDSTRVALVTGQSTGEFLTDVQLNQMGAGNYWGHIERHVTLYDKSSGKLLGDKFYSYAHDAADGKLNGFVFEGRTMFAPQLFAKPTTANQSRLVYNVFRQGHWELHITTNGGIESAIILKDYILWDIRDDLDSKGRQIWVLSKCSGLTSKEQTAARFYFPDWETRLYSWEDAAGKLTRLKSYPNRLPKLANVFLGSNQHTPNGYRNPVLTVQEGEELKLLLVSPELKMTSEVLELP